MARYISTNDTAKLIRQRLNAAFPGVKFSVRGSKYSGGSSIRVRWTDGPATKMVDTIVKPYAGAGFDGMIDLKYHSEAFLTSDGRAFFAQTSGTEGSAGVVPAAKALKPHADAERVQFLADYVFTERSYSREFLERAQAAAQRKLGFTFNVATNSYDGSAYADTFGAVDEEWKRRELNAFIHRRAVA